MKTTQKICFFNTTKFWGGGEKWHFEAAEQMAQTSNPTFFVCDKSSDLSKKLKNCSVVQYHLSSSNYSFLHPKKQSKLVRFFRNNKIDVVVFNSPKDLKIGGLAAKRAGVKRIVYRRGIAVKVKKSFTNNYLFKHIVTHFIFNSQATKNLVLQNYASLVAQKKSAVIYNAIGFPINEPVIPTNQNKTILIGNAGRLVDQKGQKCLIPLAKKLKEKDLPFKILIAGDGPLFTEIKQEISQYKLEDYVQLLGFVEDMQNFMNQIDILVSVALWEGFGFVLAEGMVAKKPVLAFNLSSNSELVKDNHNGFLIPPNQLDTLVDKLSLLIKDTDLRKKQGDWGYSFAKKNFERGNQFNKLKTFILT